MLKTEWEENLPEEIGYWKWVFKQKELWEKENMAERLDPDLAVQDYIAAYLSDAIHPDSLVRILDVGAGPLTTIGKKWGQRRVQVTAVDALADSYNAVLEEAGIRGPVQTRKGTAETLGDDFAPDTFDFAMASNSLDHCYDPVLAIRMMLAVVKPGGHIGLRHRPNEAVFENWSGLHQFNFNLADVMFRLSRQDSVNRIGGIDTVAVPVIFQTKLVLWSKNRQVMVDDAIADLALPVEHSHHQNFQWIYSVFKKRYRGLGG